MFLPHPLDLLLVFDPNLCLLWDIAPNSSFSTITCSSVYYGSQINSKHQLSFKAIRKWYTSPLPLKHVLRQQPDTLILWRFKPHPELFVWFWRLTLCAIPTKRNYAYLKAKSQGETRWKRKNVLQMQISFQKCESKVGSLSFHQKG